MNKHPPHLRYAEEAIKHNSSEVFTSEEDEASMIKTVGKIATYGLTFLAGAIYALATCDD